LRGEVFAKATWTSSPKLNVEFGVRMEVSHIQSSGDVVLQKTLQYPKPRLAVAWSPTPADQIRVRLEREVGQLDFNDFVAASSLSTGQILAGNPNLTPQQAWVVEAAYERSFLKDGAATLTVRHSALSDVIDRAPVIALSGDYDAPANIGGGSKDELIGDLSLPLQGFGVAGGLLKTDLTWRRSQVTDPTTGASRPISGLKPFEGTVSFSQDLPRWKLSWGGDLNVGWSQTYYRYDQIETDTLSPVGGLFVEVRPTPGWSVRMEAHDIGLGFDRRLVNWADLRGRGVAYTSLDDRDLKLGPIAYLRLRRNW
jgi:outer membrane receptor protein involved in Fe transport